MAPTWRSSGRLCHGLVYWSEPSVVCHVRFSEWSRDGHLRFPIFSALRPDLSPEDCVVE